MSEKSKTKTDSVREALLDDLEDANTKEHVELIGQKLEALKKFKED